MLNNIMTLKSGLESLKLIMLPFESLVKASNSSSIATMAVSSIVCEI